MSKLKNKKILITAGPTVEKIDDVRYISNFSTGKMGYAIAETAQELGAEVTLISGLTNIDAPKEVTIINIESAREMIQQVEKIKYDQDIFIMTAAVSDFRPKNQFNGKIKKEASSNEMTIELVKNPDILQSVGQNKTQHQFVCGFALESADGIENARKKLDYKNADMIVLNYANKEGEGFGSDTNKISVVTKDSEKHFEKMTKKECASVILEFISEKLS